MDLVKICKRKLLDNNMSNIIFLCFWYVLDIVIIYLILFWIFIKMLLEVEIVVCRR